MKVVYRWFGFALMVTAGLFFIYYCAENWGSVPKNILDLQFLSSLIVASFIYLVAFFLSAFAWRLMLISQGQDVQVSQVLAIVLVSQFGKYIPGNVGHHLGRIVMARDIGLVGGPVIFTMVLEAVGVVLAALTVGLISFYVTDSIKVLSVLEFSVKDNILIYMLSGAAIFLGLLSIYAKDLARQLHQWIKNWHVRFPRLGSLLVCYLLYSVNYLLLGVILYFLASLPVFGSGGHYWLLTGVFSFSWIVGYLTPGAPGGLGVREAATVLMLEPVFGSGIALSLALALRIVTTCGDAIGFMIGLAIHRWAK